MLAARLPAHLMFSMLKHAERLIQRPAEASSIKSPPHGREGGGKSGEKANESLPQSHRAGRISDCPPMPAGQTSSTASPALPACLLEELLLQQQPLAGGSGYIQNPLCEGECTERKSRERRGGSPSRAGETEGDKRPSRAREGRTQHLHPHIPSIPTHPVGRASNRDETCQRSEAREGRRRGASRRGFLSEEKNSTSAPSPTTLLHVSHTGAEKEPEFGWDGRFILTKKNQGTGSHQTALTAAARPKKAPLVRERDL